MVRERSLTPSGLIYPLFVLEEQDRLEVITTQLGSGLSIDT